MTADERALLAAVLEHRADDTPRLAYADWLDDHAGRVTCRWCEGSGRDRRPEPVDTAKGRMVYVGPVGPCPVCRGKGDRSDGRQERAELIRVQCELAARLGTLGDERYTALVTRVTELLRGGHHTGVENRDAWTTCRPCRTGFRRGFVAEVYGPLEYLRAYLPALVAREPVERVDVSDRGPIRHQWFANEGRDETPGPLIDTATVSSNWLPWSLARRLAGAAVRTDYPQFTRSEWRFGDDGPARDALSAALLAEAKGVAVTAAAG